MKTFKSVALSTFAAVATLMATAVSVPAQACTNCTIRLNGPVLNGPVIQGISLQGPVLQGPILQGISLQGPVLQGPIIQGPIVQGPMLQGPAATGAHVGRYVAVTLPSGETIPVR